MEEQKNLSRQKIEETLVSDYQILCQIWLTFLSTINIALISGLKMQENKVFAINSMQWKRDPSKEKLGKLVFSGAAAGRRF